jgi:hypothetical protein
VSASAARRDPHGTISVGLIRRRLRRKRKPALKKISLLC